MKLIVGVALVDDPEAPQRFLAARRTHPEGFVGLWEFPGGKLEPGETIEDAGRRELAEELRVSLDIIGNFPGPEHHPDAPDGVWPLTDVYVMAMLWAHTRDQPQLQVHDQTAWVDAGNLEGLPWISVNRPIARAAVAAMGQWGRPKG